MLQSHRRHKTDIWQAGDPPQDDKITFNDRDVSVWHKIYTIYY